MNNRDIKLYHIKSTIKQMSLQESHQAKVVGEIINEVFLIFLI